MDEQITFSRVWRFADRGVDVHTYQPGQTVTVVDGPCSPETCSERCAELALQGGAAAKNNPRRRGTKPSTEEET